MLTCGIIGFGERGKGLRRIITECVPDIELIAAADPLPGRRKEIAQWGLKAYESAEELLDKVCPNIAVVATDPTQHYEPVIMAAQRGSHILCEKPLALSPEEADKMVAAVRKARVVATVDFETVFTDAFDVLKRCLKEEGFGKLIRFDATDKGRPPAYDIETCMPHFLHLFMTATHSEPIEVFGRVLVDRRKATLDDVAHINDLYPQGRSHDIGLRADSIEASYLFDNGITARFSLSELDETYVIEAGKHAKPGSEFMNFVAFGTRGQVKWHQTSTGYVFRKKVPQDTLSVMDWEPLYAPERPDPTWTVPTARLIQDFVEAIKSGHEPLVTIESAARIVDQTYGIYASHLAGRPVKLPLEERRHPLRAIS